MDAIVYTAYGGPEVTRLQRMPIPLPRAGEVQVKVTAAGLNPIDYHQRNGELKAVMPKTFPVIAGNELSGIVSALGEGVSAFELGDKVVCRSEKATWSALAEYTVMPGSIVAKAPTSVSLVEAAGLPLAGLTAYQCLKALGVKTGDKLLITGGSGGVGQFAIQLAKLMGAHVTTTASSAGRELVTKAGADTVIDYKRDAMPLRRFDLVFDTIGRDALHEEVVPSVKKGGKIISVGGPQTPGCLDASLSWYMRPIVNAYLTWKSWTVSSAASANDVEYRYMFMKADGDDLRVLAEYVDAGKLTITVDSIHGKQDFAKAFERLESGRSKGKVIVRFE